MTDNDTTQTGGTIIDFASRTGRIGFNLAPTTTLDSPVVAPPNALTPAPDAAPSSGRRSPLDILATLAHPGVRQPVITAPPQPQPDNASFTFRSEPSGDLIGPRMGALSLAAILAVAVAALRGSHTVASTWWERRQARSAEGDQLREARLKHQLAMQGIHDKAAQQRAKKAPASHEFGRKTLNRSSGARSGGSGSGGGGRGSSSRPSGLSSGSGRKNGAKTSQGGSAGASKTKGGLLGGGSGSGKSGGGRGSGGAGRGPKPKGPKAPHRTSQGGGASLKKAGGKRGPSSSKGKDTGGRTTLAGALKKDTHNAAKRRLKQRRQHGLDKPVLWKDGQAGGKNADLKKQTPKNKNSKTNGKVNGSGKAQQNTSSKKTRKSDPSKPDQARWNDIKKAAQRRWKKRQKTANDTNTKQAQSKANNASWWAKARDYARNHGTKDNNGRDMPRTGQDAGTSGSGTKGRSGGRRSPFENVGQATAGTTYTVERDDYVGAQAKRRGADALTTGPAALDAATTPHTQRPGTTRPKEPNPMPPAPVPARTDPRIVKARNQAARTGNAVAGRQMDAQHATEITLDDAIDEYGDFKDDAFKTHDQSAKLANRARKLRDILVVFAEDLAVNHNLIGPLFSAAMARMAESMDLVARMSDEMETSSLQAAEMSETADNDLNDTYRPYNVATADAGLTTPSAPIHNET